MLLEHVDALSNTRAPVVCITQYGRAADAGAVACKTSTVVYLRAGQSSCDGSRFVSGFDSRRRGVLLLARHVDLAERTNAIGDSRLVLVGVPCVNTLSKVRHLHGQYEDCEGGGGESTDHQ